MQRRIRSKGLQRMPIHVFCLGGALFFAGLLIFLILFTMERIFKIQQRYTGSHDRHVLQ